MNTLMKRMGIALVLILGILSAGVASATVTYHWQPISAPPEFNGSYDVGTITIDDAAWRNGFLTFDETVSYEDPNSYGYFPSSPIILFNAYSGFPITPRQNLYPYEGWSLAASLTFDQETGFMLGDLTAATFDTDLSMSTGSDGLWTITSYVTDIPTEGCSSSPPLCSGATGRWVFYSVPEPPEIPIFALGLILILGLGLTRGFSSAQLSSASRHVSRNA
ncbi:MAG: hypothetical protein ABI389_01415 [Rhodanobacter sp.]